MPLIYMMLLQAATPTALTDIQQRDIDCVATFGLIAHQQQRSAAGVDRFRKLALPGKTYAGLVGSRLVEETGLSREVIAAAIAGSARAQAGAAVEAGNPATYLAERYAVCEPLLDAEIAVGNDLPLPVPQGR